MLMTDIFVAPTRCAPERYIYTHLSQVLPENTIGLHYFNVYLVFRRDETPVKPAKEGRNWYIFTNVPKKTDMYANPYRGIYKIQFSPMWEGGIKNTAKCKIFPQKICQNPYLYLQVIPCGNQRISLGFMWSDASIFMWNADFLRQSFANYKRLLE